MRTTFYTLNTSGTIVHSGFSEADISVDAVLETLRNNGVEPKGTGLVGYVATDSEVEVYMMEKLDEPIPHPYKPDLIEGTE